MTERKYGPSQQPQAEQVLRVVRDEGYNQFGFPPIHGEFQGEGYEGKRGTITRTAYEIPVPWGRVKELVQGVGGDMEAVVTTEWPDGTVDIITSDKALRYIDKEVKSREKANLARQ